jgi:hypothetical protein
MGAANALAAFRLYGGKVPPASMAALLYMALVAKDHDQEPSWWEGHEALSEMAFGRKAPAREDDPNERRAALQSVSRALAPLFAAGAITTTRHAFGSGGRTVTARYRLWLTTPAPHGNRGARVPHGNRGAQTARAPRKVQPRPTESAAAPHRNRRTEEEEEKEERDNDTSLVPTKVEGSPGGARQEIAQHSGGERGDRPGAAPGPATDGRAPRPGQPGADRDGHRPGRGQCKDCGGWFRIAALGAVARHDGTLRLSGECPGSGHQPVHPVPCAQCGKTGVSLSARGLCPGCRKGRRPPPGHAPGPGTGICPACGHAHKTRDGRMVNHGGRPPCPGSGQPAARQVTIPWDQAQAIVDAFLDGHQDWRERHWGARRALTDTAGRMLAEDASQEQIERGLAALVAADGRPAQLRAYTGAQR